MRKLILFVLVLSSLLLFNTTLAQSIGPRLGINMAKIVGGAEIEDEFEEGVSYRAGLQFGLTAEFPITDLISFQPELLYVQKGYSLDEEFFGQEVKVDAVLNYFELPLLAKININKGPTQFFVNIGPSFSYGLDGKVTSSFGGFEEEIDADFSDDEVNRIDFNGVLGLGVQFEAGQGKVFLDGRYVHDFTDFTSASEDSPDEPVYNRNFGFAVGYLYSFQQTNKEEVVDK